MYKRLKRILCLVMTFMLTVAFNTVSLVNTESLEVFDWSIVETMDAIDTSLTMNTSDDTYGENTTKTAKS